MPDDFSKFGDVFKKFLKEQNLNKKYEEKRLISMWPEIMGRPIASRTTNIYINDEILFVTLNSAPLKQEMNHAKEKVIKIISEKVGPGIIKDVRFM